MNVQLKCIKYNKEQLCSHKRYGLVRDLNPGPLAPKARIIPLDQRATYKMVSKHINLTVLVSSWSDLIYALKHSLCCHPNCFTNTAVTSLRHTVQYCKSLVYGIQSTAYSTLLYETASITKDKVIITDRPFIWNTKMTRGDVATWLRVLNLVNLFTGLAAVAYSLCSGWTRNPVDADARH